MNTNKIFQKIALIGFLFHQILFLLVAGFCNHIIIIVNSFFKPFTQEYWIWYSSIYQPELYENLLVNIVFILKYCFILFFICLIIYALSNMNYSNVVRYCIPTIGLVIYICCFLLIRYLANHYYLYMSLFSSEILSIVSIFFIFTKNSDIKSTQKKGVL